MLNWLRYPFIRIAPSFAIGILLFEYLGRPDQEARNLAFMFLLLLVAMILVVSRGKKFFSLNPVVGVASMLAVLITGFLAAGSHYQLHYNDHFSKQDFSFYRGVVNSNPENRGNYTRLVLKVQEVNEVDWKRARGNVQLYLPSGGPDSITYGSVLLVSGSPTETTKPRNPFEFDYATYLSRKNIFHQHFLNAGDFLITGHNYPNAVKGFAGRISKQANSVLQENIPDSEKQGILQAMVLGIRTGMDEEVKKAYSHTGVMHVLAISGLHVGIIYGFLALIFAPLRKSRRGKYLFTLLILLILWFYAVMVGLSPSVMRATVMFSLIAIGQLFYRSPDIYNTIAFSGLLLLIIDPFQIFDVGFQLSYLAVLGIVLMFRQLDSLVSSRFWVVNKIWSLTAVAIAAQVVTFPLAIHYFHNFPNLFFLANLVVIPSAFVILISGLSLLLAALVPVDFLVGMLSDVLSYTVGFMNQTVIAIEKINFSSFSEVYIEGRNVLLIYIVVLSIISIVIQRKVMWFYVLVTTSIILAASTIYTSLYRKDQKMMVVYDVTGSTVIDHYQKGFLFSNFPGPPKAEFSYHVENCRLAFSGSKTAKAINRKVIDNTGMDLLSVSGKKLVWINEQLDSYLEGLSGIKIDYLLISNNSVSDLDQLLTIFDPEYIILDRSNSYYYSQRMVEYSKNRDIQVFDTRTSGGLIFDLETNEIKTDS